MIKKVGKGTYIFSGKDASAVLIRGLKKGKLNFFSGISWFEPQRKRTVLHNTIDILTEQKRRQHVTDT